MTSVCKRIGTAVSPSALMGSSSWTRLRSTFTPFFSRKSTRSCEVTEPKSLPSSEAWRRSSYRSEEHTSELQSRGHLVCRLLLEKKKTNKNTSTTQPTNNHPLSTDD